jgi:hypothetical protein
MTNELVKTEEKQDAALAIQAEQNIVQRGVAEEVPMIDGLDAEYRYRLPRIGKLHLGVKVRSQGGSEYPKATDYFVLPDELLKDEGFRAILEALGENPDKPRKLPIQLPCNALMGNLRSSCDLYGSSRGLLCRTFDGLTCGKVDTTTGEIIQEACKMPACGEFDKGGCHWIHRLRIILPDAPGVGVWQVDTTSPNNRANLLTEMRSIKQMCGGLGGVDLYLTLESQDFQIPMQSKNGGKVEVRKTTAWLLHIRSPLSLRKLTEEAKDARAYDSTEVEDFDLTLDDQPVVTEEEYPPEGVEVAADGSFEMGEPEPEPEPSSEEMLPLIEKLHEQREEAINGKPEGISEAEKAEIERRELIEAIRERCVQHQIGTTAIGALVMDITGSQQPVTALGLDELKILNKRISE